MSNMSCCRFQNTESDLRDCAENLTDDLSEDEARARKRLITICAQIVEEAKRFDLPPFDNQDEDSAETGNVEIP